MIDRRDNCPLRSNADQADQDEDRRGDACDDLTFIGFAEPVDRDMVNIARAGQTVPVKFRLVDASGAAVSDASAIVGLTSRTDATVCANQPTDVVETYVADTGLRYLGAGNWQYSWKTPKSYLGECRTMVLALRDGSAYEARFAFK